MGMSSMMGETASMIYEATGKKSKEAFLAMKAIALAEATIKGYQAVMNAFESGSKINYGMGVAAAAMAMGFVGTQIGLITSQMVNGPEGKAKGGPIEGGSGTKDDVPIMAMKDEYVIKQSSARKYGRNFLDALNAGLIPVSGLNFAIPSMPDTDYHKTHFADGGNVGSVKDTPITVELKNESGTPLKSSKASSTFDGQQYIISVVLDGLDRNVMGMRDRFGGQ